MEYSCTRCVKQMLDHLSLIQIKSLKYLLTLLIQESRIYRQFIYIGMDLNQRLHQIGSDALPIKLPTELPDFTNYHVLCYRPLYCFLRRQLHLPLTCFSLSSVTLQPPELKRDGAVNIHYKYRYLVMFIEYHAVIATNWKSSSSSSIRYKKECYSNKTTIILVYYH